MGSLHDTGGTEDRPNDKASDRREAMCSEFASLWTTHGSLGPGGGAHGSLGPGGGVLVFTVCLLQGCLSIVRIWLPVWQ